MKVFLSWSGDESRDVAQVFKDWMPAVIQAVRPYFSPADIEKGARWSSEIAKELEQSKVGIICVTESNLTAPWIMFEAGALAKSMEKSRVIPLLLGVEPSDLSGPLTQFQAASFNKEEIRKILITVNSALAEGSLEPGILDSVFEKWWPELEENVLSIFEKSQKSTQKKARTERELLEEILEIVRAGKYEGDMYDPIMLRPIDDLDITPETNISLKSENIYYIGDLAKMQPIELLTLTHIGKRAINDARAALSKKGIELGTPIPGWPPKF